MNRRILAAVLALGLALVGTVVLVSYVRGADARALAGVQTTPVLVVTEPVTKGTPAKDLAHSVRLEQIPVKVAATGSVGALADLGDKVATTDLEAGEQLLASRFAGASSLLPPGTVAAPPGDSEISVKLEPQRAVGGRLKAGDKIGIYVSMDLEDTEHNNKKVGTTYSVLHGILVTDIQGGLPQVSESAGKGGTATAAASTPAPAGSVMITMAMMARDAERIVFGMEHGTVWLSLEPEGADTSGTDIITQSNVYGKVVLP